MFNQHKDKDENEKDKYQMISLLWNLKDKAKGQGETYESLAYVYKFEITEREVYQGVREKEPFGGK